VLGAISTAVLINAGRPTPHRMEGQAS